MNHKLKTWPHYYEMVIEGIKKFEVRKNDRDFQVGDVLTLQEYDPSTLQLTGNESIKIIIYVLPGGQFGIEQGYCVLGFE